MGNDEKNEREGESEKMELVWIEIGTKATRASNKRRRQRGPRTKITRSTIATY